MCDSVFLTTKKKKNDHWKRILRWLHSNKAKHQLKVLTPFKAIWKSQTSAVVVTIKKEATAILQSQKLARGEKKKGGD